MWIPLVLRNQNTLVNRWCLSNISRLVLLVEVTDRQRGILKNKKNKNSLVLRMLIALSDFLQTIYRINYLFQIVPGEMLQTLLAVTKSTT